MITANIRPIEQSLMPEECWDYSQQPIAGAQLTHAWSPQLAVQYESDARSVRSMRRKGHSPWTLARAGQSIRASAPRRLLKPKRPVAAEAW